MALARASQALARFAESAHAAADAVQRLKGGSGGAGSDRARADEILRGLRPQELAALKKKLGL